MASIKALTISQPFAELIASGEKWVENRNWQTSYRGPLAIHAGSGTQYLTKRELAEYATGAIVATAELIACVNINAFTPADEQELLRYGWTAEDVLEHPHCEGPYAWVLYEVRRCAEPYPIAGKQGLWTASITDHASLAF